jgi:hypothetical protein
MNHLSIFIFWVLLLILVSFIKLNESKRRGEAGESFVYKRLSKLDPAYYRILGDLMLPSKGNTPTTQIDFVVVSNYGIFCIEAKAHKGWISGNPNWRYWTQTNFRRKDRFYNPLRQNFSHTKAIEDIIGSERLKKRVVSLVVFMYADKLFISGTDLVGNTRDIINKIQTFTEPIYTNEERDEICILLIDANITDKSSRKAHNKEVRNIKRY